MDQTYFDLVELRTMNFAAFCGLDEQGRSDAVVQAWDALRKYDGPQLAPSHWAEIGVKRVRAGRDLPGIKPRKGQDALDVALRCGSMEGYADRRPGPDRLAADREIGELWINMISERNMEINRMRTEGVDNRTIARRFNLTVARVSMIAHESVDKWHTIE